MNPMPAAPSSPRSSLAPAELPALAPAPPLAGPALLVPLDGSRFAECALPVALSIAEAMAARLELAAVVIPLPLEPDGEPDSAAYLATYLAEVEEDLRLRGTQLVSAALLHGQAHEELLAHAEAVGAELVVMATHGRGPVSRFWLGSVADAVVRRARIPVLLVHPTPRDQHQNQHPLNGKPSFRNILIPVSGHDEPDAAVDRAIHFGEPFGASYTLVHVIHPHADPIPQPQPQTPAAECEAIGLTRDSAVHALARVAARMRRQGLQVAEEVAVDPDVASGIRSVARLVGADLIAMSTHRKAALRRLLIASVAHKLVRTSELPVLLFREEVES